MNFFLMSGNMRPFASFKQFVFVCKFCWLWSHRVWPNIMSEKMSIRFFSFFLFFRNEIARIDIICVFSLSLSEWLSHICRVFFFIFKSTYIHVYLGSYCIRALVVTYYFTANIWKKHDILSSSRIFFSPFYLISRSYSHPKRMATFRSFGNSCKCYRVCVSVCVWVCVNLFVCLFAISPLD